MGFDIFVLCRALLLLNQSGNGKSRSLGRSGREFGEPIFGRLFDSPKYYSTRVGLFPRATVLRLRQERSSPLSRRLPCHEAEPPTTQRRQHPMNGQSAQHSRSD
jgi:hypothetical protein